MDVWHNVWLLLFVYILQRFSLIMTVVKSRNMLLLLLLIKRYNLYKVLACSTDLFQLSLFCATFFQLPMFMLFISSKTSSFQRVLGLPIDLLDTGFHLLSIVLTSHVHMSSNSYFILLTCLDRSKIICPAFPSWAFLASSFPVWESWPHDKPPTWRTGICLGLSPLDGLPSPRLRTPV
jgi:hypothetical protein